jgi:hypothetical protein
MVECCLAKLGIVARRVHRLINQLLGLSTSGTALKFKIQNLRQPGRRNIISEVEQLVPLVAAAGAQAPW